MKNLYKLFLNENIANEYINEQFDYKFNNECDKEKFIIEYKKFLGIYNAVSYNEDRFVTVFNGYEIRLNVKDIEQLIRLCLYTTENNLENERFVLLDFLYTYSNTINSNKYKKNYLKHNEAKKEFEKSLEKFNYRKEFYTKSINILYQFYKRLIKYAFKNEIYINNELINRIFNNLRQEEKYYNELIEMFINNKSNIYKIIKFDKEKEKHINTYLEYIDNSLENFGKYNYVKEMLLELEKSRCLSYEAMNKIINKYIDIVNKECKKLKDKTYSFICGLSEIEDLKNELNYILKNIGTLTSIQKDKIKECLRQILCLKRTLIADDEYLNSEMHAMSFEEDIKKEEIEKYKEDILGNEYLIYSASKLDFCKQIENALELYSQYPLQSLVSYYKVDSAKNIYATGVEDRKKQKNDNFKKIFDQKGKEYTQKNNNLINKLSKDYYEEFLKYLSKTFIMQQELIILTIGHENLKKIIEKLKKSINYDYNNDYAIVLNNILAIESNIIKFMKKKNLSNNEDGFENINKLVNNFKEDEDVINGLMYLNYILYEKSGLNLRNYIMHGTLINSNLDVPLMVTFSGLIFVSWLLNER